MRPPPVFTVIVLLMLSALALGCEGDQTGTTAAPTPTATTATTPPPGQPSAVVQSQLEAVLDELMSDGVFGGHALCSAYTADVSDLKVSVGFTLRNSTDPAYSGFNRTMTDVLQEYASRVAGYFGPNPALGAAYGSRAVQADFTIYGVHIARYSYTPPPIGGGVQGWSAITFYMNPEIYATYTPPAKLNAFALYNNTSSCDTRYGLTVYLGCTDANGNATWEPGDYVLEVMTNENSTAYSNSYFIGNDFLEYPGITYGIFIDATALSKPRDNVTYILAFHTRLSDGMVLNASAPVFDAQCS